MAIALLSLSSLAQADGIGYQKISDCQVESEHLLAVHHHDWSSATRDARWQMISTTQNVFTPENSYASLVVEDKRTHTQLFKVPTPALTQLWISDDSRFIVGISSIKLWNPVQVVVFNARGVLLVAKQVETGTFPGVVESVTNYVWWYKEPSPRFSLQATGDSYTLRIEGNQGTDREFTFKDIPQ
jgi:hypothetical protein